MDSNRGVWESEYAIDRGVWERQRDLGAKRLWAGGYMTKWMHGLETDGSSTTVVRLDFS